MCEQNRRYTDAFPCINLKFLKLIRLRLEDAEPGAQLYADTDSGRFYVIRKAGGYTITTGNRTYSLRLTSTLAGYGVRHWYYCPLCTRRCGKLYIGRQHVGCRQCLHLHYASQSENTSDRMMRSVRRRRLALWGESVPYAELMNLGMPPPLFMKPDNMHWKTFERRCDALVAYEARFWQAERIKLSRYFPRAF